MSARLRLTLSYTAFLMVACIALSGLLLYVIRFVPVGDLTTDDGFVPDRNDLLAALWPKLLVVLAVLALIGPVAGWFLAGRMLRPLRDMQRVARQVAAGSFAPRVKAAGSRDEFRELADAFDLMLDRLQAAFDEQGRFAANASHELRTPYAIERAMLDVALANPEGVDVSRLLSRLDDTNRRGTETVEALLALAALDQERLAGHAPIDLAELSASIVEDLEPLAARAGIVVRTKFGEGDLDGVESLVRHLVTNLVLNGIRHNADPGGDVMVTTGTTRNGCAELRVSNTGPVVPADVLATLTEPFVRGAGRLAPTAGSGLGLAIVKRVAGVHQADLHLTALPAGGLDVRVTFAAPAG